MPTNRKRRAVAATDSDKIPPSDSVVKSCLNNSFFSSALREWVDQVALGGFTPEHRAKLRADEKRRTTISKQEETTWKSKFFEENWGDKIMDDVESTPCSSLFFPQSKPSSNFSQACLKTIFSSYGGETMESPPDTPPPLSASLPLPTLPSSTTPPSPTASSLRNVLSLSPSSPSTKKHSPSPLPPPPSLTPPLSTLPFPLSSTSPAKCSGPAIGQSPPALQPLPPPKPTTPPQAKPKTQSPKATTIVLTKKGVKLTTKNALVQRRNHVAKRVLNKVAVVPLQVKSDEKKSPGKLIAAATSAARSDSVTNKFSTAKIIEQWRHNNQHGNLNRDSARGEDVAASHFLSRLPPRTPYQTLLIALAKASKPIKATLYIKGTSNHPPHTHLLSNPLQAKSDPPSATSHTHSVFHDHFSLLSKSHVPLEFCAPIATFPVKWPIEVYRTCLCGRQVQKEHSYSSRVTEEGERKGGKTDKEKMNLKLSVPRSILRTSDCLCNKVSLVFCSHCNSLYHSVCGASTLCPTCSAP